MKFWAVLNAIFGLCCIGLGVVIIFTGETPPPALVAGVAFMGLGLGLLAITEGR